MSASLMGGVAAASAAVLAVLLARQVRRRRDADGRARKIAEELEAAHRELEAFSYSVSHDLRAPLRSIQGFSQAVLEDQASKLDEAGRVDLRRIGAAAKLMGELIDDLLSLSRIARASMAREEVDLSFHANKTISEFRQEQPDRTIDVTVQPDLRAVGDEVLLSTVLQNLLENAWKFTSGTERPRIEVGRTVVDGLPCFYVRDNGAGFDMAYAGKLFAPFQRLHRQEEFKGTGIGLATAQRVVHRHGGRIWCDAKPGEGATFYFTIQ